MRPEDLSMGTARDRDASVRFENSLRDDNVVSSFHRGESCPEHEPTWRTDRDPGCTVVICTHRRPESLKRFLESLLLQDRRPERLVIVDASPDEETELAVRCYPALEFLADCVFYFRVAGPLRGLTRQRNFALLWVRTDLIVFFDDDVVLLPGCLSQMEKTHHALGGAVVGVGAAMQNEPVEPGWLWRLRRRLWIVSTLEPGRYCRSGMSIPWGSLGVSEKPTEGDWLPGCGMMWKTATVAELGFHEAFEGYAQGEDLDFSLRALRKGKLMMAPAARLLHLQDRAGRPDDFKLGYSAIYNRYQIHRRGLPGRTWWDIAWFVYAWLLDTLLLARNFRFPRRILPTLREIAGRLKATGVLFAERSAGQPGSSWPDDSTVEHDTAALSPPRRR